ncbi:MAG TPA: NUDIX hydrolase [Actinomycetota bacterium]|nr:NUDIX hydrolase [Actinomycetota bacterium]
MDEIWRGPVADSFDSHEVTASRTQFHGAVWDVRSDEVLIGDHAVTRDLVVHPGAVGVVALDEHDRLLLIRQYRHPVGGYLFEPPAGLLDTHRESAWECARRELAEEAGLRAREWHVLIDFLNSPGGTSETFRCFLARDLQSLPEGREHTGEAEEAHLPATWVDLDEAVGHVLAGRIQNPTATNGILAAAAARSRGWRDLRPADAPWPVRNWVESLGNVRTPPV